MKFDHSVLQHYVKETFICYEKHPFADLHIYGYYESPDAPVVWDDISKNCRGIILDGSGNVVELPFEKFWTFKQYISDDLVLLNDNRIMQIPQGKFRITEKVDGTMVTLYWVDEKPYLATQRSFTNVKAIEATKILYEKYSHLFNTFNKRYTYVFEAIYPETKVLIQYGDTRDLILIGMIDKETGKPVPVQEIGFRICKDYTPLYGNITDFDDLAALNLPNQEGFVIYFDNGDMMKLKFPWYKNAHSILDKFMKSDKSAYFSFKDLSEILDIKLKRITKDDIIKALENGDEDCKDILIHVPSFYYLMGFDYWLQLMKSIIRDNKVPLFPQPEYFDFEERMRSPNIYETCIWKWEERFLKH